MNISEFTRNEEAAVDIKQHIFQTAGLGLAPYKFLGVTEKTHCVPGGTPRAGGSCDYCGTAIRWEFHLQSADKHAFKVGSDCICKADDRGLAIVVAGHKTKMRRLAAAAKKRALYEQKMALLAEIRAFLWKHEAAFRAIPHPLGGTNYNYTTRTSTPRTWFDYGVWMSCNCGIEKLVKLLVEANQALAFFAASHP